MQDIQMKALTLGTIICRFTVPQNVIDEINNDYDNAIENFRIAIELNPYKQDYKDEIETIANIEILKGKEFYDRKEYQDALIHFNKALEYDPKNSSAMFRLGNIYYAIRDYVKAAEFYQKVLSIKNLHIDFYSRAQNKLAEVNYD